MRVFFAAIAVACVSIRLLAQEGVQTPEGKAPFMVSFTDLKWVELPEQKALPQLLIRRLA